MRARGVNLRVHIWKSGHSPENPLFPILMVHHVWDGLSRKTRPPSCDLWSCSFMAAFTSPCGATSVHPYLVRTPRWSRISPERLPSSPTYTKPSPVLVWFTVGGQGVTIHEQVLVPLSLTRCSCRWLCHPQLTMKFDSSSVYGFREWWKPTSVLPRINKQQLQNRSKTRFAWLYIRINTSPIYKYLPPHAMAVIHWI